MEERRPLTKAAELVGMDHDELVEGYLDGCRGEPEPGGNRSIAYWHGWRNGASDRAGTCDAAQRSLARDLIRQAS